MVDTHQDREDNKYTMFVTKREGEHNFGIYTLYEHKLYDLTHYFEEEPFHSKPNIVFLFSVSETTEFIL